MMNELGPGLAGRTAARNVPLSVFDLVCVANSCYKTLSLKDLAWHRGIFRANQ